MKLYRAYSLVADQDYGEICYHWYISERPDGLERPFEEIVEDEVVKKKWTLFLSRFFHCHHFFKFFRTQIPKIRMTTPTVVPHFYIINDITPSLFPG